MIVKKEIKNIQEQSSGDQEFIESIVEAYNFEKIETFKIAADTSISIGWLIFAFCALNVIKRWIFLKD